MDRERGPSGAAGRGGTCRAAAAAGGASGTSFRLARNRRLYFIVMRGAIASALVDLVLSEDERFLGTLKGGSDEFSFDFDFDFDFYFIFQFLFFVYGMFLLLYVEILGWL